MLIVVGIILVLLASVLIYASWKPDTFRLERSTVINAPPDRLFALINDFHCWPAWSPWEKMDPNLKRTYSGAPAGQGAVYAWEGNKKVGEGRMEILSATVPSKVVIKLDFLKPFEAHNTAEFTMEPGAGQATTAGGPGTSAGGPTTAGGGPTKVTWAMHGPQPFMFKVMTLFFNMDKTVGKDFDAGLSNMKAAAES
jgi:uncharacterized protein YndB with AHSA1/START domain